MSEAQFHTIVRGRLAKDDFVVDDGVQGYMDNGVDDFEEPDERYESDEGPKGKGAFFYSVSFHSAPGILSAMPVLD